LLGAGPKSKVMPAENSKIVFECAPLKPQLAQRSGGAPFAPGHRGGPKSKQQPLKKPRGRGFTSRVSEKLKIAWAGVPGFLGISRRCADKAADKAWQ